MERFKEAIVTIFAVFGGLFIAFVILAIVMPESEVTPEPEVVATQSQPEGPALNDELRTIFIEGCMSGGASYGFCACAYSHLLNNLGQEKFMRMAIEYAEDEELTTEMLDATVACMDRL